MNRAGICFLFRLLGGGFAPGLGFLIYTGMNRLANLFSPRLFT